MHNILYYLFLINTSSWMFDNRELVYEKTLYEITIPGTHDSASYHLQNGVYTDIPDLYKDLIDIATYLKLPIDTIVSNWTQTQVVNISKQLSLGSRYLDLRLCVHNNSWFMHHNFVVGLPIEIVLKQIRDFVIANQGEIVLLDITHVFDANQQYISKLNNTLYTFFSEFLYRDTVYNNQTIGRLVGSGQRVFIISDIDIFMYQQLVVNNWANTDKLDSLIKYSDNAMDRWNMYREKSLFKLGWVLTPSLRTVFDTILTNGSLLDLESNLDNMLIQWMYNHSVINKRCPVFPNIITVDFIENMQICVGLLLSLFECKL